MPLYEYKCEDCGFRFEVLVLPKQDEKIKCPKCDSEKVKQTLSTFASYSCGSGKRGFFT